MAFSFQDIKGTDIIWKLLKRMNDINKLSLKIVDEKEECLDTYENESNINQNNNCGNVLQEPTID